MSKVIRVVINQEPVAKARPRVKLVAGKVWTFTPTKTQKAQEFIKERLMHHIDKTFGKNVGLRLTATFWRTKSKYLPKRETLPFRKPDIINFGSLLLDGMSTTIFNDDAQITELRIRKRWTDKDYGYISLKLELDKGGD